MQGVVDFLLLDILLTVLGAESGPCFWPSLLLLSHFQSSQRGSTKTDDINQNYSPVRF